ncbi:hypothetical protein GGF31_004419 [Allomyces arbusculus]|nr:hypothetical protein GGF31_004419 [Allomyces arbusculus]
MRLLVSVHPPDAPVGAAMTAPLRFVFAVPAHAVHIGDLAHAILDRAGFDQEAAVAALSLDGFNLVPEDAVATVLTNNDKVDVHVTHIIPPPRSACKKRARAPSPDAYMPDADASTRSRKRVRTLAPAAALPARSARARSAVADALVDSDALDAVTHHLASLIARQAVGAAAAAGDDDEDDDDDDDDEEEDDDDEEEAEDAVQYDVAEEDEDEVDDDDYEDAAEEDDDEEDSDEAPDELPARAHAKTTTTASRGAPFVHEEEEDDEDEDEDYEAEEEEEEDDDDLDDDEAADDNVEPLVTDSDDEAITSAYDQLLKDLQPAPAVSTNGKKSTVTKADNDDDDDDDDDEDDSDFEMASEDGAVSDSDSSSSSSSSSSSDKEEDGAVPVPAAPALTFDAMDDSDSDSDSDASYSTVPALAVTAVDCTKFPATKCAPTDARQVLATAVNGEKKKKKTRRGTRGGAQKSGTKGAAAATVEASAVINFAKCAKLTPMMARKVPAGTQLAFKQMHLSEDCTPEVSEYRMAKVLDQQGVEFTVQWATPITEKAAKTKSRGTPLADDAQWVLNYDEENGGDVRPRGLAKFIFEDGTANNSGDTETVTFAEMVEPVIVSWGSRPATAATPANQPATPSPSSVVEVRMS